MERKEQTGHICRWMALGIMTAIVIVGCTIVIGLFEWRDRKEIECRNAELHQWRKCLLPSSKSAAVLVAESSR